ncbi:MAG: homogentisate 1,2-dioxygenase [Bacteroidia bacterium]|nr:homogentisate 1,2-dioxygenase [Bacteroidia bacterium]MDW8332584.1 homogentisate 1,2-dioxygenase [Bacteroidia bacterium]
MPYYQTRGKIPRKRHTVFRDASERLLSEELVSTEGFSSLYSLVYHVHAPTKIVSLGEPEDLSPPIAVENNAAHRSFRGFALEPADDYLQSRTPVLINDDVCLTLAAPRKGVEGFFYKNATHDELIFVHQGSGTLETGYGELRFSYGDYIHVPRGVIYQIRFDTPDNRLFIIESASPIAFPKKYLNRYGQLEEHSPFCERDIRGPENFKTYDERGEFLIKIKKNHLLWPYVYATHPFDFVGWDGWFYPYVFSIHDFEPITGRIHQPPPVHQTFEARNFVVCSFVPRLYDYHPDAVVVPYNHSNVDSDEVLYYVDGDFMSRKHVERGQITLHPMGIPHGPHPGAVERSFGQEETRELAVMVDTFRPLKITRAAMRLEDPSYLRSWL